MVDFVQITAKSIKKGELEVYPKFLLYTNKSKVTDLMIRGGDFYAVWLEDEGLWSTDEDEVGRIIDKAVRVRVEETRAKYPDMIVKGRYMQDADSGVIDSWHKYCQKQTRDNYHSLDEKIIFLNQETKKEDYASKHLNYPIMEGPTPCFDKIIETLYSESERTKIEWVIGSIITGDSVRLQKFMALYGSAGTGKSTVINIIQKLFEGYCGVFRAKVLGSNASAFPLEAFKNNPLVAIDHDADLSRIEDNTVINSLVSHEPMNVNEKFKATYTNSFKSFLIMGSNKPVKITDAKSGIIRRLIDVSPTGVTLPKNEYDKCVAGIDFELGAIAFKCKEVYLADKHKYDDYKPIGMFEETNDFYNFVNDNYLYFDENDGVSVKAGWKMYKEWCEDANINYPFDLRRFKNELKNYFEYFEKDYKLPNGSVAREYMHGFIFDSFTSQGKKKPKVKEESTDWIIFDGTVSALDKFCEDCPAQYTKEDETPIKKWDNVRETLKDIDTSKLHYLKVPENLIVIDLDLKDETGSKSLELNLKEANKFPPTYVEVSKGGQGLHLHYIYHGDVTKLSSLYATDIEIKTFTGKSSLRRRLTKFGSLDISVLSSGLPQRKEKKVVNFDAVKSEKALRTLIAKNLKKQYHPATKPSMDFIFKNLEDAYNSGLEYDVSDMKGAVIAFAAASSHQASYCLSLCDKMHFTSKEKEVGDMAIPAVGPVDISLGNGSRALLQKKIFFDIEVYPNLLLICYKMQGKDKKVVDMVNPTADEVEAWLDMIERENILLIGFNCKNYDNHIVYEAGMGYSNQRLYQSSQSIIKARKGEKCLAKHGPAYNLSGTDIYDFMSAGNKMSLKKWEIKLGIHHMEMGIPWDEPAPEELWPRIIEYCHNDVISTEAVFEYKKVQADWMARCILADITGLSVNDSTNNLTTALIFGNSKNNQNEFCYRNLAEPVKELDPAVYDFLKMACPEMMETRHGKEESILPYFPGYHQEGKKSVYRDRVAGEGGYVEAEEKLTNIFGGVYENVALLDVASMHPHSTIAECLFGPKYTIIFRELVEARVEIKHKNWDVARQMLGGKLSPYIDKVISGEFQTKDLANALKTAINSVYGLTAAHFNNAFRDPRNVDNIVAKRGALFMIELSYEVKKRGYTVAHIKTDSIKIPNATPEIIEFVMKFGKKYGYTFEHEATYERMCLINKAVYVAKFATAEKCKKLYGYSPAENLEEGGQWTFTGDTFAVPYVKKTLFTHEPVIFEDYCSTFATTKGDLQLDMNENLPDVSEYENLMKKLEDKYKKGKLSDISFEEECKGLPEKIAEGHKMQFVGRVGQFTPVKEGVGGGILYQVIDGKPGAASGTIGYRWMESEVVRSTGGVNMVDVGYFRDLVDEAKQIISEFCERSGYTYDWFVNAPEGTDIPQRPQPEWMNVPITDDEELPFYV